MDIHDVRQQLKKRSIFDIPLRVTYYARVSTDSDEQVNSLENQMTHYTEMITKNPRWTMVPGYIDEGISGISTKKRENFNLMIEDASEGKFDLILTKEISRFARNTLDSIQYTRTLLNYGVCVFFQNDNINTIDDDSELRLAIMSSIAQDELRKLSSRVKFGHQQAIKANVVLGNSRIFGYRKENKHLVIDEEEAKMVRILFELYATNEFSMKQIEKILWEKGYRNHNGNKIAHTTMSNMIANPKYKGYYVGNKVRIIDMFSKKQKFLPPEEWVMFKDETGDIVPAIVSEELWEKANAVLQRRSDDVKGRQGICNHANLLTGKLWCTDCGAPYYRKESKDKYGNKNSKWICSHKAKYGTDTCKSIPIYESEIAPILLVVFRDAQADTEAMIEEYIRIYKELTSDSVRLGRISEQQKIIDLANRKKSKLLDYNVSGRIDDDDFIRMTNQLKQEVKAAEATLAELQSQQRSNEDFRKHLDAIRYKLIEAQRDAALGVISKDFIDQYIDKIYVTPEPDGAIRLDIRIYTGETTSKYLRDLVVKKAKYLPEPASEQGDNSVSSVCGFDFRAGQMFKKMIEAYENGMK